MLRLRTSSSNLFGSFVASASSSSFSSFRFCSSSTTTTTTTTPSSSSPATNELPSAYSAADAQRKHNEMWTKKKSSSSSSGGLKKTSLIESLELEEQRNSLSSSDSSGSNNNNDSNESSSNSNVEEQQQQKQEIKMWCSVPTLYRRLIKLIINKFEGHPDIIIRGWKQIKYEFFTFRQAPSEEIPELVNRGHAIYNAIQGGIVPIIQDQKTGLAYCKYDKATLAAAGGVVDPISAEEFLRRNHDKLSKEEVKELRDGLKEVGRWSGKDEVTKEDLPKIKTKRKVKCTDPDE